MVWVFRFESEYMPSLASYHLMQSIDAFLKFKSPMTSRLDIRFLAFSNGLRADSPT